AVLWSIVAGPLVNVALFPILQFLVLATGRHSFIAVSPDVHRTAVELWVTNIFLLVFNLLPFYPLDGGQIVRALLWFRLGPIRSLTVAGALGIAGSACLGVWAVISTSI